MSTSDPEAPYLEYVNDIFEQLESGGYPYFKDVYLEKNIKPMQVKLYPTVIKEVMKSHFYYHERIKENVTY